MKRVLVILFTFFNVVMIQAETLSSEYLFQAKRDQHFLGIKIGEVSAEVYSGSDRQNFSARFFDINYEYGVLDALSVYGNINYLSSDPLMGQPMKGIGPLSTGLKYAQNLGPGLIFSKLDISAGIVGGKFGCNDLECQPSDTAIGATLQLAYQWSLDNAQLGLSVIHGLYSSDLKFKDGARAKKSAKMMMSVFYERGLGDGLYGAVLTYIKDTGPFGTASIYPIFSTGFKMESMLLSIDALSLEGYFKVPLSESLQAISSLEYSRILSDSQISTKTNSMFFNIGLRKAF